MLILIYNKLFITQAFLLLMNLAIPLTIVNSSTTYTLSVFCSSSTFGVFLLHSINFVSCFVPILNSSTQTGTIHLVVHTPGGTCTSC